MSHPNLTPNLPLTPRPVGGAATPPRAPLAARVGCLGSNANPDRHPDPGLIRTLIRTLTLALALTPTLTLTLTLTLILTLTTGWLPWIVQQLAAGNP